MKKKVLLSFPALMLAICFWATPMETVAQGYDRLEGEWARDLCVAVKYVRKYIGDGFVDEPRYGYVNRQRKVVIPCVYTHADSFSEKYGVAYVAKKHSLGIINTKGVAVIPLSPTNTDISTTGEIDQRGFIEVTNEYDKKACFTTEGKKLMDYGSYDDWRVKYIKEPYVMFFKERKGVRYFSVYTIKGKVIIPFTASVKSYNHPYSTGYVEVNEKDGYVRLESDILEIGTGKMLHENVEVIGNFMKKDGKYYLFGKGGKIVDGFVFDSVLSVEDDFAVVSKDGKNMFFNFKTKNIDDDYDEIIPIGRHSFIKHDKKLNKWIIPYTDDDNNHQIDTVNNIEIVNNLIVSEKHTYWNSAFDGLSLCSCQVTRKHQQFGDIAFIYDIEPVIDYGEKHDRILQFKPKRYATLSFFDYDSIIDVIETKKYQNETDYNFVVLGKDKKYYICDHLGFKVREYTGPDPKTKKFHCSKNNTDYSYYAVSHRLCDNRTGKECKWDGIEPLINNGECEYTIVKAIDVVKTPVKRKAQDGRIYVDTSISHIGKVRLVPFVEILENEKAYLKYAELKFNWDPQTDVSLNVAVNAPIKIGNENGFIMSKSHRLAPGSTAIVADYALVCPKKGYVIPFIRSEIKDVIFVGEEMLGVVYGDKSLFSLKKGYGLVNTKGQTVVKSKYDVIGNFVKVDGEYMALVSYDGKKGYINLNGEEVIPCKYDELSEFKNGVATATRKGKTIQINTKNKKVK